MQVSRERLEIRIPSPMLASLKKEARARSVPVAELVRQAISLYLETDMRERMEAAQQLFRIGAPVDGWEVMKREISEAYAKSLDDA